jgi:multiple sugar transport system ATP-binding protein
MADRIGVLNQGRIVQIGSAKDIYDRPANTFVAQLVGTPRINLLPAHRENGNLQVKESQLQLPVPAGLALPEDFLLGIRPEDIIPDPEGSFEGSMVLKEPLGVETIVHLKSGGVTVVSLLPGMSHLKIGDTIRFRILTDRLHAFTPDGLRVQE